MRGEIKSFPQKVVKKTKH